MRSSYAAALNSQSASATLLVPNEFFQTQPGTRSIFFILILDLGVFGSPAS
jgi:hypothetical protein